MEPTRIEHLVTVRYDLAEPLRVEEGKWVSRQTGYFLPVTWRMVEIVGVLITGDDETPRFWIEAYGDTETKNGRVGSRYRETFSDSGARWGRSETPPLFIELRERVRRYLAFPHSWPWPDPDDEARP